jgi:hypothetical protein
MLARPGSNRHVLREQLEFQSCRTKAGNALKNRQNLPNTHYLVLRNEMTARATLNFRHN